MNMNEYYHFRLTRVKQCSYFVITKRNNSFFCFSAKQQSGEILGGETTN